ncbi:hypothetical protein [Leptospira ainazelensis]|nr:hypothetical protein [Leptospira ainazelensis]
MSASFIKSIVFLFSSEDTYIVAISMLIVTDLFFTNTTLDYDS